MPITLQNAAGESKAFEPEDVAAAVQSGEWGAAYGTPIPVTFAGSPQTVPIEELLPALKKGAAVISPEDHAKALLQEQYGDIGHQLEAAGTGAASGLTFGLSDAAIGGLGGQAVRESIRKSQQANPYITGGAKLAGALAPVIATLGAGGAVEAGGAVARGAVEAGEAGLEAAEAGRAVAGAAEAIPEAAAEALPEAATPAVQAAQSAAQAAQATSAPSWAMRGLQAAAAPQEAVTRVGELVERGVGAMLPSEARGLAARLGVKAATLGARGAVEGGIYGAGDYLSEASLSDNPQLDGEKLLAAVGHGALLGGLLGGGLGAASEAVPGIVGKVMGGGERGVSLEESTSRAGTESVVRGVAEERAAKSVISGRGQLRSVKDFERVPGGIKAVGRELLDRNLIKAGDSIDEIAPRIEAAREQVGSRLGELGQLADASGAEGPKIVPIVEKLSQANGGLLEKLKAFPSVTAGTTDRVKALVADLTSHADETGTLSFVQARDLRSKLDQMLKWEKPAPGMASPFQDALRDVRGALEEQVEKAMDRAAPQLGRDALAEYKAAKLSYRKLAVADDAAQRAVSSKASNRIVSGSDYGTGIVGALGAGMLGLVPGVGLVTGLATSLAHKVIRERGAATAAVFLDKIAAMGAIKRASAAVDRNLVRGVDGVMGRKAAEVKRLPAHGLDNFADQAEAVQSAAVNMGSHAAQVGQATAALAQHAPTITSSMQSAAIRATVYLADHLPKPRPSNPLAPSVNPIEPSDHEKRQFGRIFMAVHDPVSVLQDVRNGTVTPEQVAAISATHPALKADMDRRILGELARSTKPLSYERAVALSMFLGQATDPSLAPQNVAAFQATYAALPKAEGGQPTGKRSGAAKADKLHLASDTSLSTSRTT